MSIKTVSIKMVYSLLLMSLFMTAFANSLSSRIYRGETAKRGQLPYQVLLLQESTDNRTEFCGGALVSRRHVLTAAHCFNSEYIRSLVYLGVLDTKDRTGVSYLTVNKDGTVLHPQYNPQNFQNDIAILILPAEATLSENVQIIQLPKSGWSRSSTFDNYQVTVSGWGQTFDTEGGVHRLLQYQRVFVLPHAECASSLSRVLPVTESMICTDKTRVPSGPCRGDSGGPMTVNLKSGLYLIGVVSWGVGDCSGPEPVVYTAVSSYLPWIEHHTGVPYQ